MRSFYRITICALLILPPAVIFAVPDTLRTNVPDSLLTTTPDTLLTKAPGTLRRNTIRDSLLLLKEQRGALRGRPIHGTDPFSLETPRIFSNDATSPSEALSDFPFCIPVRFGLSSQLNRFLPYGNVGSAMTVFNGETLIPSASGPLTGTDNISLAEVSTIAMGPGNTFRYSLYPENIAVPEGSFFWENGVFDENILNARFLRPLSAHMTVNLFSSYRYFAAKRFTHDGNNVSSFYKELYTDTTVVSDSGYNPLTSEYEAGTRVRWTGSSGNEVLIGVKYADWSTEMALDRPARVASIFWTRLNQYRSSVDLGIMKNRIAGSVIDISGNFENNAVVKFIPDSSGRSLVRKDGSDRTLSFAGRIAAPLRGADTLALLYRIRENRRGPFDMTESHALDQAPGLSLSLPYRAGPVSGGCTMNAGYNVSRLDGVFGYSPTWSVSSENRVLGHQARVYASRSAIPYSMPFDSALFLPSPLLDLCHLAGVEIALAGAAAGCVIGCQSIEGISDLSVRRAWPEGVAPYRQPRLVILAAPYVGPWHGLTIASRAAIADRKPAVKAQASAAYTAHPQNTGEYIDLRLSLDYWSERDPIVFANLRDWNREIYDLNLEIAVHVKTFRFFSKIDNILNRRIAYVPGYTLPGITFRWGITWFLQR
jgi:hypothetical protein